MVATSYQIANAAAGASEIRYGRWLLGLFVAGPGQEQKGLLVLQSPELLEVCLAPCAIPKMELQVLQPKTLAQNDGPSSTSNTAAASVSDQSDRSFSRRLARRAARLPYISFQGLRESLLPVLISRVGEREWPAFPECSGKFI